MQDSDSRHVSHGQDRDRFAILWASLVAPAIPERPLRLELLGGPPSWLDIRALPTHVDLTLGLTCNE